MCQEIKESQRTILQKNRKLIYTNSKPIIVPIIAQQAINSFWIIRTNLCYNNIITGMSCAMDSIQYETSWTPKQSDNARTNEEE